MGEARRHPRHERVHFVQEFHKRSRLLCPVSGRRRLDGACVLRQRRCHVLSIAKGSRGDDLGRRLAPCRRSIRYFHKYRPAVRDGTEVGAPAGNGPEDISYASTFLDGDVFIGEFNPAVTAFNFEGEIKEIQIYSAALNQAEIQSVALTGVLGNIYVDDDGEVNVSSVDCTGGGLPFFAFDKIQDAEDLASDGDTIFVCPSNDDGGIPFTDEVDGIEAYVEDVVVDVPNLTIVDEGSGTKPVVYGGDVEDGVFNVESTGVTIDGFVVESTATQWGIILEVGSDGSTVKNNEVDGNALGGIRVDSNTNDIGPGNDVHHNDGDGIQVNAGPDNFIEDNGDGSPGGIHDNEGKGIYLTDGADFNTVRRNTVQRNGDSLVDAGIRIDSNNNAIFHNHVSEDNPTAGPATCGILSGPFHSPAW